MSETPKTGFLMVQVRWDVFSGVCLKFCLLGGFSFFSTKPSLKQLKTYFSKNLLVDIKKPAFHWIRNLHIISDVIQSYIFLLWPTYKCNHAFFI